MSKQVKGTIQLLVCSFIWGVAFVAQSEGMKYVGPWTFICTRYLLGAVVLIPVIIFFDKYDAKRREKELSREEKNTIWKNTVIGGICSGVFLVSASLFQQYGICETSVGKAGFITALYIIIVPFFSIFLHKKIGLNAWISAVIACVGFYFLSIKGYTAINRGDILLLICAVLYSLQILTIDKFVDKVNTIAMSSVQFAVSAIVGAVGMLIFETPTWAGIQGAALPILYAGLMSSGVAYTLQIVGQQNLPPTIASLLMSLESVFSALAGWVLLGQGLNKKELLGCALVFAGVIIAQITPEKKE